MTTHSHAYEETTDVETDLTQGDDSGDSLTGHDEYDNELTTEGLELEERQALRRVVGMSTELTDISEVEYRKLLLERVLLVGVWTEGSAEDAENSLAELKLLAETAGSEVLDGVIQRRKKPDAATFIGSGKVTDLRNLVASLGVDTVIADGELAPAQLRNLEDRLKVKVVDRTALILDIFAQHAKSKEGKAQVELAQLQYMKQRLRGWGGNLSRQAGGRVGAAGGGIGGRGPGETKIETDRRRINTKIAKLRRDAQEPEEHPLDDAPGASPQPGSVGRDRGVHQRRQVLAAEPAHRRGRAGRGRAVRDPGPDDPPYDDLRRPRVHASPTRSGSSGTCRTTSSRRSARRWRRSRTPTCCCTWWTVRTRTRSRRSRQSARCCPRSARPTYRRSW